MNGSDATSPILLSDKLSLVTHHRLLTRVPVKLDLENWNYASWVYFFKQLCSGYEVSKYIHGFSVDASLSTLTPLTSEDLKAELRSLKLGDLSIDAYFRKIESITTIIISLRSPVSSKDVVTFALEGLPKKYDHVCGNSRRLSTPQVKSWRPCFNFSKHMCRFGDDCKFVHDENVQPSMNSGVEKKRDNTDELLVKTLGYLGLDNPTGRLTGIEVSKLVKSASALTSSSSSE
uniref:Hybrid signal transduction histidine kinase M n=1 Tax=Tanacetum cinerariifolium TaxID=118510 RepID=A0A6L2KVT2_TANCI|nr:hybrid signal transduction histidine kinase M [Tanacetum cinerariifolium]